MVNQSKNLNDDMVKLVAYSIVSIRREDERVLDGGEGTVLIVEPMTEETFTAYIIGHYLQQEVTNDKEDAIHDISDALDRYLREVGEGSVRKFAEALRRYLREAISDNKKKKTTAEKKLRQISEKDRKYLRVNYVVSNRWPRESLKFEEEQVTVLEDIRDKLP
jgi:hypothetical protein